MKIVIVLVIFILIIVNIIRALLKGMQREGERQPSAGEENPSGGMAPASFRNVFSNRVRNEAWMSAAAELDMMYIRPPNLLGRPALRGECKELIAEAHIEYSASGSLATVCSVQFPKNLGLGLLIVHDDEQVPEEEFAGRKQLKIVALDSRNVKCAADDAAAVKLFLTQKCINVLKNAVSFYRFVKITDDYVLLKLQGECRETKDLTKMIEFAVSIATILSADSADAPVPFSLSGPPIKPVTADSELYAPPVTKTLSEKPSFAATPPPSVLPARSPEVKPATVPPPSATAPASFPELRPASFVKPAEPSPAAPVSTGYDEFTSDEPIEQNTLAASLFSASFPGQKEQDSFKTVKGRNIDWRGELKSSYQFANDFVLGCGPAVKAVFEIAELSGSYSMKIRVKAVVRLPLEALELLKNQNGKQFRFTGRLEKFEAFAKEIIVIDGALK